MTTFGFWCYSCISVLSKLLIASFWLLDIASYRLYACIMYALQRKLPKPESREMTPDTPNSEASDSSQVLVGCEIVVNLMPSAL